MHAPGGWTWKCQRKIVVMKNSENSEHELQHLAQHLPQSNEWKLNEKSWGKVSIYANTLKIAIVIGA